MKRCRHVEADGSPREPGRAYVPGDPTRDVPREGTPERRHQHEEPDDGRIAADCESRQHQRGNPRRVYRIDLAVESAPQKARAPLAGKVGVIVAPAMVVLDAQIPVGTEGSA